jgi:hypothetical protein
MPWAATACLAAAVACVGGVLSVEKAKGRVLADELALSQDALKAAQNQLVAERIVSRREIEDLEAQSGNAGPLVNVLLPPDNPASGADGSRPVAVAALLDGRRVVAVMIYRVPAQGPGRDYQVWADGGAGCTVASQPFHAEKAERQRLLRISLPAEAPPGSRFLLIEGKKGGFSSLPDALASGSIVLASTGPSPSISGR